MSFAIHEFFAVPNPRSAAVWSIKGLQRLGLVFASVFNRADAYRSVAAKLHHLELLLAGVPEYTKLPEGADLFALLQSEETACHALLAQPPGPCHPVSSVRLRLALVGGVARYPAAYHPRHVVHSPGRDVLIGRRVWRDNEGSQGESRQNQRRQGKGANGLRQGLHSRLCLADDALGWRDGSFLTA